MTAVSPATKAARQAQIAGILTHAQVRSQEELAGMLADRGVHVAQATLSRDLEELGAVRLRGAAGALVYALPSDPGGPGSWPGGVGATGPEGTAASAGPPARPGGRSGTAGPGGHAGHGGAAGEPAAFGALPRVAAELLVSAEASASSWAPPAGVRSTTRFALDRKSTRLNSSHT